LEYIAYLYIDDFPTKISSWSVGQGHCSANLSGSPDHGASDWDFSGSSWKMGSGWALDE